VFVKRKGNQAADRNGSHRDILVHVDGSVEIVEKSGGLTLAGC